MICLLLTFVGQRYSQMLAFIQTLPSVVERLLKHIESPAFVDLLFRIMQLDEYSSSSGVLEVRVHMHVL